MDKYFFKIDSNPCTSNSSISSNHSQFSLEYSIDYGQSWSSIDRLPTISSYPNDILISQPFHPIKNTFYLPLYTYQSLSKLYNQFKRNNPIVFSCI